MGRMTSWRSQLSSTEKATYVAGAIGALVTLLAAVVQSVFPYLLQSDEQLAFTTLAWAGGAILVVTLAAILSQRLRRTQAAASINCRYDVFVSAPMTSLNESNYEKQRSEILQILNVLEFKCGLKCYFAGRAKSNIADMEAVDIGLDNDLRALKESRNYMLVYPQTIVSSVLVEAGMAIVLGKPSVYFVGKDAKLPFVLQGAGTGTHAEYPRARIYQYEKIPALLRQLEVNAVAIFGKSQGR